MTADGSGLRDLIARWGLAVAEVWADEVTAAEREAAPVRTGKTRDAITHTPVGTTGDAFGFQVQAPGIGAVTSSKGARPHVIRPVKGKVLVFQVESGETVFARSVDHPGNTGSDWFGQALREQGQAALERAARSAQTAAR